MKESQAVANERYAVIVPERIAARRAFLGLSQAEVADRMRVLAIGPREVMQVLGHSTIAITMDVYSHVADDALRDKMERVDEWRSR